MIEAFNSSSLTPIKKKRKERFMPEAIIGKVYEGNVIVDKIGGKYIAKRVLKNSYTIAKIVF